MDDIYNEPAYSKNVLELLRVAHEYILFIEGGGEKTATELLDFISKVGPLLYLKGELLPEIEVEYPEASERFVTEEEWENVFLSLRKVFGTGDIFYYIDPDDSQNIEPVKASLSENFTDIYQDLKDFVLLYQKHSKTSKINAVHDCFQLFGSRWGVKILRCMNYIHYQKFTPEPDTPFN